MTEPPAPTPTPPPPSPAPPPARRRRSSLLRLSWLLAAVAAVALIANDAWNSSASPDAHDLAQVGTLVLLLLLAGPALLGRRLAVRDIMGALAGWLIVLLVAATGYAYRSEIASAGGRVLAVLAPGVPIPGRMVGEENATSVVVMRGRGGQFVVRALVDDVPLKMMIDTGASLVTLTLADAVGTGVDPRGLAFTVPVRTANGVIRTAPVTIKRLVVGAIERNNMRALVAPPDSLAESLLGMSFLETLGSYTISGDRLVLNN